MASWLFLCFRKWRKSHIESFFSFFRKSYGLSSGDCLYTLNRSNPPHKIPLFWGLIVFDFGFLVLSIAWAVFFEPAQNIFFQSNFKINLSVRYVRYEKINFCILLTVSRVPKYFFNAPNKKTNFYEIHNHFLKGCFFMFFFMRKAAL